jgi:hypothetical protein
MGYVPLSALFNTRPACFVDHHSLVTAHSCRIFSFSRTPFRLKSLPHSSRSKDLKGWPVQISLSLSSRSVTPLVVAIEKRNAGGRFSFILPQVESSIATTSCFPPSHHGFESHPPSLRSAHIQATPYTFYAYYLWPGLLLRHTSLTPNPMKRRQPPTSLPTNSSSSKSIHLMLPFFLVNLPRKSHWGVSRNGRKARADVARVVAGENGALFPDFEMSRYFK